jgi:hypothetical protein
VAPSRTRSSAPWCRGSPGAAGRAWPPPASFSLGPRFTKPLPVSLPCSKSGEFLSFGQKSENQPILLPDRTGFREIQVR